jgi:mRNA-degrading endonuclease toxin of MazEF toxin-antitoxin module
MPILRSEVYYLELGPTRGRELDLKRRPVVVVSVDDINLKPLVIAVIPGTTHRLDKRIYKNQVKVEPSGANGLTSSTRFECVQIKALDHSRFDRGPAGALSSEDMSRIEKAMKLCLGLL